MPRYIFRVNGKTSADTFPTREAATNAAFLFAGDVMAVVSVKPV